MATKGDISGLDILMYGGLPMIPLVQNYSQRKFGAVVNSEVNGGLSRQRKKYYGQTYTADATYQLDSQYMQDYMKMFFERNEGKRFVAHLRADRPLLEPYVVQVIGPWENEYESGKDGSLTIQLEITSVRDPELDDVMFLLYQAYGEIVTEAILAINRIVHSMPGEQELQDGAYPLINAIVINMPEV